MTNLDIIAGRGITYPFKIDNGRVNLETGWDLIKSNLFNFFSFEKGTRYFLSEYGILLRALLGDPNDQVLITTLEYRLENDIPQWDPRLKILGLDVRKENDTKISVSIVIGLSGTPLSETFIFPFYNEIIY